MWTINKHSQLSAKQWWWAISVELADIANEKPEKEGLYYPSDVMIWMFVPQDHVILTYFN